MDFKIAVIGLGYVGLPLAVEFGKKFPTVGYDISESRVVELNSGLDTTLEATPDELASANQLSFTTTPSEIESCNIFIVTVPTPIDGSNT